MFLDQYRIRPRDLIELVDGILYQEAKAYIQEQEMQKAARQRSEQQKQGR